MAANVQRRQDEVLSGGFGKPIESARSGYLPISLERVPGVCFSGIPIHLRAGGARDVKETFTLYCGAGFHLDSAHVARLLGRGIKFIYIPISEQRRFRLQIETQLKNVIDDSSVAVSVKSELLYEAAIELVNEVMSQPQLLADFSRIENISRAATALVLAEPGCFAHLFAASHHDFYTATHMVNVAFWMLPLAKSLGYSDPEELNHICQAGLLHDIGKVYIPAEILNIKGRLTAAQLARVQRHPVIGAQYLDRFNGIHPLVPIVAREHHERADGSGYPRGITGADMHPVSRISAVVDSFDAMTAFRPYKRGTLSTEDAIALIVRQTPEKYDGEVVEAWIGLLRSAAQLRPRLPVTKSGKGRRLYPRFPINCPARVHVIEAPATASKPGALAVAHNISRSGMGLLCRQRIRPGERIVIRLQGGGSLQRNVVGISVRCREYGDGRYEIAMQYGKVVAQKRAPEVRQLRKAS